MKQKSVYGIEKEYKYVSFFSECAFPYGDNECVFPYGDNCQYPCNMY